jgi:two-component system chemotaxis response regulator CheY
VKILLVDDSKTMRNIQRSVLTELGATEIVEAGDGLEALSKLETFQPDLALVDGVMPNMDGLSFVRAFRERDKKTPIIMVTTESERSQVIEAIKAGVDNYVVKPFTPDLLAQRVGETMKKRKVA